MIYRIRGIFWLKKKHFVDLKPFYYRHHKTIEDGRQSLINSLYKTSLLNQKETNASQESRWSWLADHLEM